MAKQQPIIQEALDENKTMMTAKEIELYKETLRLRDALALYRSMVLCGEKESNRSKRVFDDAMIQSAR